MNILSTAKIQSCAKAHLEEAKAFLLGLLALPSVPGSEGEAQRCVRDSFRKIGCHVREAPVAETIRQDPEYTHPESLVPYEGRPNILVVAGGPGAGRSLVLNTHVDVVPAGFWQGAFDPVTKGDLIIGRGAVDCKGQIGALYLLFCMLEELGVELDSSLTAQIVIEEEVGGNGTLSLIRQGCLADAAVVLEATNLTVCPANRGAVWFKATVLGKATHMSGKISGVSAIDKSIELIQLLYEYEAQLREESKGQPLFAEYECPVQVNIGRLIAGDWPSTVPGLAVLEGGVGFLPNKDINTIKREVLSLPARGDDWLSTHVKIEFPGLHNDSYQIPPTHPLVEGMVKSCERVGIETRVRGLTASCDARLFNKLVGMPTIVFGAGGMEQAHSDGERLRVEELVLEACALFDFVCRWCGIREIGRP